MKGFMDDKTRKIIEDANTIIECLTDNENGKAFHTHAMTNPIKNPIFNVDGISVKSAISELVMQLECQAPMVEKWKATEWYFKKYGFYSNEYGEYFELTEQLIISAYRNRLTPTDEDSGKMVEAWDNDNENEKTTGMLIGVDDDDYTIVKYLVKVEGDVDDFKIKAKNETWGHEWFKHAKLLESDGE